MGILKTFKMGGIHPAEHKLSADKKIESFPVPEQLFIPLGQHIGAPAVPVVKKNDIVKTGQLIAEAKGGFSANIHAPASGKVFKIDKVITSSGYKEDVIIIKTDGDDWMEGIDKSDILVKEIRDTQDQIRDKVFNAGIVGLGGATFPTHIKLKVPKDKKVDTLVINGVECEPYLTADHRVMLEKGDEVIIGIQLLMKAIGVEKAVIGIENNKKDAIEHLTKIAEDYDKEGIKVIPLKVQYPQGGEKQLIKAVLNREVPSGKLPLEVGCVVQNVGTAFAVYEAVQKNKPLIERVVTVTGVSLEKPCNLMVRVGTPISKLIEHAGGLPEDSKKVINGGPMMGKALNSLEAPVVKGSSGILVMPEKMGSRVRPRSCIRCGKCITVCPMGLAPYLLENLAKRGLFEECESEQIMDCIECGSCSYTCPAGRELLDYIRVGKSKVNQLRRSRG